MIVLKTILWTSVSAATLGVLGCDVYVGGHDDMHRGQYSQRTYVEQPVEQPVQYVLLEQAPPPLIVERRPAPPSGNYIWIDGYWNWTNQRYTWQAGRYEAPPQPDVVWIAPRYEVVGGKTHYYAGQWKKQDQGNGRGRGHTGN
jgi:hypothetical protein